MKMMKVATLLTVATLFAASPMIAQETTTAEPEPATMTTMLMRVAKSLGLEGLMLEQFKAKFMANADVESAPFDQETKEALAEMLIERFDMETFLSEAIVPVVEKHFTVAEIGQIASFIESDLGKRVIDAQTSGEEFDFMAMMSDGSVSREEAMEAMQLFMTLGPKLKELQGGDLSKELETSMKAWGQNYFTTLMTEMIQNASK